jgi:hypothetical protein
LTGDVRRMLWSLTGGGNADYRMNVKTSRPLRARLLLPVSALVTGAALVLVAVTAVSNPTGQARALASCIHHTPTAEEMQLVTSVSQRRQSLYPGSPALKPSQPLNDSAYGYAKFLADNPGADGHSADGGFWYNRSLNCGYPAEINAGGEGLAVKEMPDTVVSLSASEAYQIMIGSPGGGANVPPNIGFTPVSCFGVGKATASDGSKVAWVLVLFVEQLDGTCPQAAVATPPPPPSPSPTATPISAFPSRSPSPTATPTRSATPTPSATPSSPRYGVTITLAQNGWTLVTLPQGSIADILSRASGCYVAVYQLRGDQWLRFAPDVPAYARNLSQSDGGAFWILGSAQACGPIQL